MVNLAQRNGINIKDVAWSKLRVFSLSWQEGSSCHVYLMISRATEEQYVVGAQSPEAQGLIRACRLNLASCYLNSGATSQCVTLCDIILAKEPSNCKSLFRRGQVSCQPETYASATHCKHYSKPLMLQPCHSLSWQQAHLPYMQHQDIRHNFCKLPELKVLLCTWFCGKHTSAWWMWTMQNAVHVWPKDLIL